MATITPNNLDEIGSATAPESELLVLREAARLVKLTSDPKPAIEGILGLLSQLLGLNRGRVLIFDSTTDVLETLYAYGLTNDERARGRYEIGEGIIGKVFQSSQMALIQNIDEESTFLAKAVSRETLPDETVSFIAVPIIIDGAAVGVLAVNRLRYRDRPFQRDISLLQIVTICIAQMLRIKNLVRTVQLQTLEHCADDEWARNKSENHSQSYGIIGQSKELLQAIDLALKVANTNTTVLLLGESGTGKERFAHMQHLASDRSAGPFITINCAAIPAALMESELFGHEKGAFTGANALKRGKIELASGGTLFLDEMGDLDLDLQPKLLKVLEQKVIQRVGGSKNIDVDVRIVAATHKNLQEAVKRNRFRLDLFYRLHIFPIRLPPLRDRQGDVPILANYFLDIVNQDFGRLLRFGATAIDLLDEYQWPGNIRQLENLVKRAALMSSGDVISATLIEQILRDEDDMGNQESSGDLDDELSAKLLAPPVKKYSNGMRPYTRVSDDEGQRILEALRIHRGNKTRAAISLDLTPRQLRYRIKKLDLEV
jgi:Nif-specific regulatory protein